jgi:hypothetical protein
MIQQVINGSVYNGPSELPIPSFTDMLSFKLEDEVLYRARVTYLEGLVPAGFVVSNEVFYKVVRKAFFGTLSKITVPNSSALIRELSTNILNPQKNSTLTITTYSGDKGLCFAYPRALGIAKEILQVGLGNVLDSFVRNEVNVEGAEGYSSIPYYVYHKIPALDFKGSETFILTI